MNILKFFSKEERKYRKMDRKVKKIIKKCNKGEK